MAVDIEEITANIVAFHDLTDRSVIEVGAGGGQFVDCFRQARSVLAVDPGEEAVRRLEEVVSKKLGRAVKI